MPQNSTVEYTLDLANSDGGEIAQNAVLTNVLPSGVQFTGWITQSGATLDGSTITWSAGSVPTNTVTTISFRAQVVAAPGEVVTNTVDAVAANADASSASTVIAVSGAQALLHLYLPLLQLEAAPAAGGNADSPPAAEATAPAWEGAGTPEHIFLPVVAQP